MGKNKKIIIGLFVCAILGICYYFFYWIKTPAYSINIIRESIQKHDVNTFEKHVDLDSLYNKGYDDMYVAMSKITGEDFSSNPFLAGMVQMMKPPLVAEFKHKTLEFVKGNDNSQTSNQSSQDDTQTAVINGMENKANIKNLDIRDVSTISQENDSAIIVLKVHSRNIGKDFDLKIKMNKLDDGKWKLKEITNLTEFIIETDKAEKEKLAEIDAPLKEQIYKVVETSLVKGKKHVTDGLFPSYSLNITYQLKNISGKNIIRATAYCLFSDKQKNEIASYKINDFPNMSPGATAISANNIKLNEFDATDKKIIATDPSTLRLGIKVMSVEFDDGTKIERPTKLPIITEKTKQNND